MELGDKPMKTEHLLAFNVGLRDRFWKAKSVVFKIDGQRGDMEDQGWARAKHEKPTQGSRLRPLELFFILNQQDFDLGIPNTNKGHGRFIFRSNNEIWLKSRLATSFEHPFCGI